MTARTLQLPTADGGLEAWSVGARRAVVDAPATPPRTRRAIAAAHVVADPLADQHGAAHLDWDATLAYRRHLWSLGLGVAEAMDTAQRGGGLGWPTARRLIEASLEQARDVGGELVCGVSTDQLPADAPADLGAVRGAYEEQLEVVESGGGRAVLMASRSLAACARGPDDYVTVYGDLLTQLRRPAILHWLGEMFDPALAGYWGGHDLDTAAETLLAIISDHADKVDGIKLSVLDADFEERLRARLPAGVRCYTGDDFAYPRLIAGDGDTHSDALLGIFDPIAPVAAAALGALDDGDRERYDELFAPTVPLARHLFSAPTFHYKTGVVLLAHLNGHQDHFRMVGGAESARSIVHLAEVFRLADVAGVLADPEMAAARFEPLLALAGIRS